MQDWVFAIRQLFRDGRLSYWIVIFEWQSTHEGTSVVRRCSQKLTVMIALVQFLSYCNLTTLSIWLGFSNLLKFVYFLLKFRKKFREISQTLILENNYGTWRPLRPNPTSTLKIDLCSLTGIIDTTRTSVVINRVLLNFFKHQIDVTLHF